MTSLRILYHFDDVNSTQMPFWAGCGATDKRTCLVIPGRGKKIVMEQHEVSKDTALTGCDVLLDKASFELNVQAYWPPVMVPLVTVLSSRSRWLSQEHTGHH